MPTLRALPFVLAVLVCAVAGAADVAAQTLPEPAKASPDGTGVAAMADIEFYLARGETDACGRGCNEWIAAEGKIDVGAAQRLRGLLTKLGRRRPPLYFHSPGGSMVGSIELGRLIREQKLVVSIAHTIPLGCDRDKQLEKSCEAQKRSGQAIEAEFDPNITMCNSGCVWIIAGAAVRLVPPWVKLGIHDVGIDPAVKNPPSSAVAEESKRVIHTRIQEYSRDMGIDKALYIATTGVPFESKRFLDRDEIARFGIDRREFGEDVWRFVDKPRPVMVKSFFVHTDDDQRRYVNGLVSVNCGVGSAIVLALVRQHLASEPPGTWSSTVGISVSGRRIDLTYLNPSLQFDTRSASLPADRLDAIGDSTAIGVSTFGLGRDGSAGSVTLNTDGFSAAYAKLRKGCDAAARNATALAPSTMPLGTPSFDPWVQGPLADATRAASQKAPVAPPPPRADTARSDANVSTPAEPMKQGCMLQISDAPQHMTGRVTGFPSGEEASAATKAVEAALGAKINPAYLSLKRVTVEAYPQTGWVTMAAIPRDMAVKIGDLVELNSRHRDPSLLCHFIPWTINRRVDSAE
jgi:hypothetical protein